ncbi:MAG: transglutaminase [Candidatus Accumulibacter phosphatis]|uniref:Transglutaminase n=1 Tax=Candidatus Accumulibacter phosphatis TaxID=327160 RepID=A0A6A7RRZ6_9PROT|nr:transglutaminase [Candidatus Accumulibacter phosphatis]
MAKVVKHLKAVGKPSASPGSLPLLTLEHGTIPWLLAVALATAGPHAAHLPWWLSLLVGGTLLWRAWLWQQRCPLPPRWALVLLVIGSIAAIAWQFGTLLGKDAGVALLVVFMALKPMEMSSRRDALVVVMLGYFLLLTHYLYSQSIPTGAWLLAALALLTAALIRLHGGAQPVATILRHALLLLAQALPFMLILYLLFPRVAGPLWGLPQDAYSGLSGLSEEMSPGTISRLTLSGAIAFRSRFAGEPPEKSDLYWRGPVFDEYDGHTWRAHALPAKAAKQLPVVTGIGAPLAYSSILEAHNRRWLLALDIATRLPPDSALAPTLEALAREPVRVRTQFSFASSIDYRANVIEAPAILQQALALPKAINPRTRALASEWASRPPEKIAAAALAMFRNEDFYYTLRPSLLGPNAMDEFLFDNRRGFCEHYASAFVFLMRAAGVPARVVAGYQGGELNPVDGYLVVRQSDAHAWAEIWLAGQGWVRFDPTAAVAPSRIEQGIDAALPADEPLPMIVRLDSDWLRQLRNRWEAANNTWNQWVLGYNPQRQREVLSRLGWRDPDWRAMSASLAILCALALLLVTLWTLPRRLAADPVQRAWQKYCAALKRRGIPRAEWEGPLDFAHRVAREKPDLAALTNEAAGYYAELRYGRSASNGQLLRRLQQCVRRLPPRRRKHS